MATTPISKRQQARHERTLQTLVQTIPGNNTCADCNASNPGWASWSLGVFLCLRCAALHRKLGTHVSKVKSLSMDAWQAEQVENMRKVGNVRSNGYYNPRGVRADVPVDADEVDGALERFIRKKYEVRAFVAGEDGENGARRGGFASRQDTGSTAGSSSAGGGRDDDRGTWRDDPPPLPPKPGKKFGLNLRSASLPFSRSSKTSQQQRFQQERYTPPRSPSSAADAAADRINKPSQVFGMKITTVSNNFDSKLATLREMGFPDNKKNTEILKTTGGDVDRAVETLVRLGEGSGSGFPQHRQPSRTLTPVSMSSPSAGLNGLSVEKTRQAEESRREPSNNPWEIRDDTPQRAATQPTSVPSRAQSAGPESQNQSWNPFLNNAPAPSMPQQQQQQQNGQSLEHSFQNLQLSQTGPAQQQSAFQQPTQFAQQQIPQQYYNSQQVATHDQQQQQLRMQSTGPAQLWASHQPANAFQQSYAAQQPFSSQAPPPAANSAAAQQQQQQSSNPFLRRAASQTFTPSNNPWASQTQAPPVPQISSHWLQQQQPQQQLQQQQQPLQQPVQSFPPLSNQPHNNPFGLPQPETQMQQSIFQQPNTASPAPMYGQQEYFQQQQPMQASQQVQQQQPSNPWQQQMQQPQQTGYQPQLQQQQQQQQPQMQPQQTGFPQPQQPQQYQQQQPQFQQFQQQQQQQPTGRHDKTSILALYNMPHLAPQQPQQQQQPLQSLPENPGQQMNPQQRSATMPIGGAGATMNPFGQSMMTGQNGAAGGNYPNANANQDAFAGLSSRFMR